MSISSASWPRRYLSELFLYSGQYALFYLFMNLSMGLELFLHDGGHFVLLLALLLQTAISVRLTGHPVKRALSIFITPLLYTLYDAPGEMEWFYNVGHLFFWIYTSLIFVFLILAHPSSKDGVRVFSEAAITFTNISIFIFVYFYFDLKLDLIEQRMAGVIDPETYREMLEIYNIHHGFLNFIADPAHIYIIFGGLFLGLTITHGRVNNLQLTQRIDRLLARYLDPEIKERLLKVGEDSQKRKMAVLFCDIRNFTAISETHAPDTIVKTLNIYYTVLANIVTLNGGVVNKFIGDGAMVLFGLKSQTARVCDHAVSCAMEIFSALDTINRELAEAGLPGIEDIGIGIHYGDVVFGAIGGTKRKDYTVIGDTVNTASRLESLSKTLNCRMIISGTVFDALDRAWQENFTYLGDTEVKGKYNKVHLYGWAGKK